MTLVAIVYHSGFGHTEMQAKHIEKGALSLEGVTTLLLKADEAAQDATVLNKADAIVFGSPTYMGSVSAPFKTFMDATSKPWFEQSWKDKVAAGFTNSHSLSGDKLSTLIQLAIFASQHGMIWVGQAELNGSPHGEEGKDDAVNRMGSMLGAMAQSDNKPPEETPPSGDLKTAELLGRRVAGIARKLHS